MKSLLRKISPSEEFVHKNKWMRKLGPISDNPHVWKFNRGKVAAGVAIGVFFAFALPVLQFLAAGLVALVLRANLPIAMAATLVTNPLTVGPWYAAAYQVGKSVYDRGIEQAAVAGELISPVPARTGWFSGVLDAGANLAVGLAIFAVGGAAIAYAIVVVGWRIPVWRRYLRMKRKSRQAAGT